MGLKQNPLRAGLKIFQLFVADAWNIPRAEALGIFLRIRNKKLINPLVCFAIYFICGETMSRCFIYLLSLAYVKRQYMLIEEV